MTLKEWQLLVNDALVKAGFLHAGQESKWLLAAALEKETSFLLLNPLYVPSAREEEKIRVWLKRRLQGEPLSRIKGMREFWSLPFHLNQDTLDPRPESETVVEGVLQWVGEKRNFPWRILDLGTGSGCLLVSLLHELKKAQGLGVDISDKAIQMAAHNAKLNGVGDRASFLQGDWIEGIKGPFDIIVSNPPYISASEMMTLDKNVRDYDPPRALLGGKDGLDCYRLLSHFIKPLLAEKGLAVFEIGASQKKAVEAIFQKAGFNLQFSLKDLAGCDRVLGIS